MEQEISLRELIEVLLKIKTYCYYYRSIINIFAYFKFYNSTCI